MLGGDDCVIVDQEDPLGPLRQCIGYGYVVACGKPQICLAFDQDDPLAELGSHPLDGIVPRAIVEDDHMAVVRPCSKERVNAFNCVMPQIPVQHSNI